MASFPNHIDKVEAKIISRAVSYAFQRGWVITIWDGEETVLHKIGKQRRKDVEENVAATDETTFIFHKFEKDLGLHRKIGTVVFIHGNGEDVWSDNTDNEAMNTMFRNVAERYE